MINFQPTPPIEATKSPFRLVRTPAKGTLELHVTSDTLLGCYTHFFGGRTVPCSGEGCDACNAGATMRWHGYVAAITVKDQEPILFELTAAASEQLLAYRAKFGTCRGCNCQASRVAPRPNARVKLRMKPLDQSRVDLAKPFNIVQALCHIWGIPFTDANIQAEAHGPKRIVAKPATPPADRGAANGNGHDVFRIREVLGQ